MIVNISGILQIINKFFILCFDDRRKIYLKKFIKS